MNNMSFKKVKKNNKEKENISSLTDKAQLFIIEPIIEVPDFINIKVNKDIKVKPKSDIDSLPIISDTEDIDDFDKLLDGFDKELEEKKLKEEVERQKKEEQERLEEQKRLDEERKKEQEEKIKQQLASLANKDVKIVSEGKTVFENKVKQESLNNVIATLNNSVEGENKVSEDIEEKEKAEEVAEKEISEKLDDNKNTEDIDNIPVQEFVIEANEDKPKHNILGKFVKHRVNKRVDTGITEEDLEEKIKEKESYTEDVNVEYINEEDDEDNIIGIDEVTSYSLTEGGEE